MERKNLASDAGSIGFIGAGLFSAVSLLTYSSKDPSFFHVTNAPPSNACGWVGAELAAGLIAAFGLASLLVPIACGVMAVALHRREDRTRIFGALGGWSSAVLALTVLLALQWKYWPWSDVLVLTGGVFGTWIADFLLKQFNLLGASIVAGVCFLLALAASIPWSVASLLGRGTSWSLLSTARLVLVLLGAAVRALGWGGKTLFSRLSRIKTREPKIPPPPPAPIVKKSVSQPLVSDAEFVEEEPEAEAEEVFAAEAMDSPALEILSSSEKSEPVTRKKPRPAARSQSHWKLPTAEFLSKVPKVESSIDREKLVENSKILKQKFADFGIDGEITGVRPGPVITLYEFKPGPGVKVSRIAALSDDLSMALSARSVRILAPLPGKSVVGIEIPSDFRQTIYFRELVEHADFGDESLRIPVIMGKDTAGNPVFSDLARMPHLLCAGQTGSGKSVFMNGLICSFLYRFTPEQLRLILVDPKFIEFRSYQDIPHLLLPVVDDPKHASIALKWAVREMERRYRILAMLGVRNLDGYNQKVEEMGEEVVADLLNSDEQQSVPTSMSGGDWIQAFELGEEGVPQIGKLPYIVVIIDELADLMMIAKKEVEISIARIAQKARAAGIHLVIATQRPSTDVVTGLIKANLPSRVSFSLASFIDSKTILDRAGAEKLLGQGDMLFTPPGSSQIVRLHGAFMKDQEIEKVTQYLRAQGKPAYRTEILVDEEEEESSTQGSSDDDPLLMDAVEWVRSNGQASASSLQRHFKIGYNRAARMIETMETRGIVGPAEGARPREVLMR